jgi:3',5'-cyclic AMP phosphodiesterase CpdA
MREIKKIRVPVDTKGGNGYGEVLQTTVDRSVWFAFKKGIPMNKKIFEKRVDKEFTVLNLTDPQLSDTEWEESSEKRKILEHTVRELIKRTEPDLITVSGDLAWAGHDHAYDMLADLLDSFRIPWAPVWGNHDNQKGTEYIRSVADRYQKHPYCIYENGPSELGNGNYIFRITENGKTVCAFFMLDTHDRELFTDAAGETKKVWGKLLPNQLAWLEERCEELKKEGCNDAVIIQHIPIYGFRTASAAAYKEGIDLKEMTVEVSLGTECWNSGYEESVGVQHEGVASYPADEGALDVLKRIGIVRHIVAGHDHINNWIIRYDGIRMVYSLKTGAGCYWEPALSGGTVLKVGSNGVSNVYHEYVDPSEI